MMTAMDSSKAPPQEKVQEPQQQCHWLPSPPPAVAPMDERDRLLLWFRGEFAAANAMIDALCQHLKEVGEAGEYDGVIGCVEHRRCNWKPVLHMQQYFSESNVAYALQQVGVRKPRKEVKGAAQCNNQMDDEARATKESVAKSVLDGSDKSTRGRKAISTGSSDAKTDAQSKSIPDRKQVLAAVNVTDGLRLYEELFDYSVVLKLIAEVNILRVAGRRRQLQGQTFVASKRPVGKHGREIIQFGMPIVDVPHEGQGTDLKIQPIPSVFEDVIERLVAMEVVSDSAKPDCCIIDIFNEGDYMNPHTWPRWFGWPICVLFLTECDMTFGKVIGVDSPGNYKGSLMFSLTPGSMLAFEGKSSDYARHALPNTNRERIFVTFMKSLGDPPPKMYGPVPACCVSTPSIARPVLPPSHIRHPKKYGPVPASGVLNPSIACPVPQRFNALGMPFAALVALPPCLPLPGTGVFLPPSGSGKSVKQSWTDIPINGNIDRQISPAGKMNTMNNATPQEGAVYEKVQHHVCNGGIVAKGRSIAKKKEYQVADAKEIAKSTSA